ncbi:VAMP-associated protein [Patellaria atrata CBS 101060]|uniref:VAMP-associated protein n=1 Tax=Patellaria atrata CBS 101060 TaxID=1346257 RepID=A0A9P4SDM2_9PEZI|nr:VAMP-associated protein [Patellaria atrata CBS 101060]
MSVELDPVELGFRRPLTHEVSQVLRLRNPHNDPVAFKVKTTAPKQYCVRPNSGRIEPGRDVEVQVLLQAMREDPPPDAKCRDKFLVQSVAVTADKEFNNIGSIWSHIEQTNKSAIQERKIRVVFLPADGTYASPHDLTTNGYDASSARSPTPDAVTPQRGQTASFVSSIPRSESRPSESQNVVNAAASTGAPVSEGQASSTIGAMTASITSAIPTSTEEFKQQLADANATIMQLKQQVTDQGLRQRKGDAIVKGAKDGIASGVTALGVQNPPANGVPVQIVAGLCLLSFLLAYFFF